MSLIKKYRIAAIEARNRLGIELSPMTARTAAALFPFAISHEPPFQETGEHVTGFQDAVIFFSVIDDTRQSGESISALFSEDKDFAKNAPIAAAEGITFQHIRSYSAMWDIFASEIAPALSSWWSADRQAAKEAIEARKADIEVYLIKETTSESVGALVKEVRAARITDVRSAETQLPFPNFPGPYQRTPGSIITITGTLRVSFDVLAIKSALFYFSRLLSGPQKVQEQSTVLPPEPEPQEEVVSKSVELECKGKFLDERYELSDFRVVNISW